MSITETKQTIIQNLQKFIAFAESITSFSVKKPITDLVLNILRRVLSTRMLEKLFQRHVSIIKPKNEIGDVRPRELNQTVPLQEVHVASSHDPAAQGEIANLEMLQDSSSLQISQSLSRSASAIDSLSRQVLETKTNQGTLIRLDDQIWAYTPPKSVFSFFEEIQLRVPKDLIGREAYSVVQAAAKVFDEKVSRLRQSTLKAGIHVLVDDQSSHSKQTWNIRLKTPGIVAKTAKAASDALMQPLAAQDRSVLLLDIEKVPVAKRVAAAVHPVFHSESIHSFGGAEGDDLSLPMNERLFSSSFEDPFTRLATECFQKYEPCFVMETEHRGRYRFVFNKEMKIQLEQLDPSKPGYREENRKIVAAYAAFLKKEYGPAFVSQLEDSYNLSFDSMVRAGEPLLPDHVSKCNIGVNSIEIGHIQLLKDNLHKLFLDLRHHLEGRSENDLKKIPAQQYLAELLAVEPPLLSVRTARGLLRSFPQKDPNLDDLLNYLAGLEKNDARSVRDLRPETLNALVSIIMPNEEELDRAFTGRKIRHLSIMGAHTMGQAAIHNPCRDQFELLHVFADCQKTNDWKNYFELLSHVVVKKSLFRKTPGTQNSWHLGLLIPGPTSETGEQRWYCAETMFDDHAGNVNYIFLPACRQYRHHDGRLLPMVMGFRNTCFSSNSMNWQDSIAADLNPYGGPNSLKPELVAEYEQQYIQERSIPLWMGYLVAARQINQSDRESSKKYQTLLLHSAEEFIHYVEKELKGDAELKSRVAQMMVQGDFLHLEKMLSDFGMAFKEDPRFKIPQEIVFAGHSLGGALAQYAAFGFLAKESRLPMPGTRVTCFSNSGPAIDGKADAEFMAFGQKHRELLSELSIRTQITHLFEYGDFIPQAGDCNLGTTGYMEGIDSKWLDFSASVFRQTATTRIHELAAQNTKTHLKRIGKAAEGKDYTLTFLTPKELWDYHHTFFLRGRLGRAFGNTMLRAPKILESIRKKVGFWTRPIVKLYQFWSGSTIGARDSRGVFSIDGSQEQKQAFI
jgi:hypothetical protein